MRAAFSRLFKKESKLTQTQSKSKHTNSTSSSQDTDSQTTQRFQILHLWTGLILKDVDITSNFRPRSRDEAIRVLSGFLAAHPARNSEKASVRDARWNCSLALCGALYQRALHFNAIQDFDDTISRLETDLTHIPAQHDLRPVFLQILANALESRYDRQGQQADNDRLISSLRELLGLQTPADETFEASITLAYALTKRAEYAKDEKALEAAKLWLEKSMRLSSADLRLCTVQTNLGRVLIQHYERSRNQTYLRMAISWLQQAADMAPGLLEPLAHLATALHRLFKETRDIRDIDKAISRLRAVIQCIPPEHVDDILPQAHSDLAVAYLERHDVSKDVADIDQAVTWFRQATTHRRAPQTTIWQASSALGRALIKRNQISGDVHDLDEAISVLRRAESLGPGTLAAARFSSVDNVVADSLESLALALWARFNKSQAPVDFDEALKYQHKVIRLRPNLSTSNSLFLLVAILNDGPDRPNNPPSPDELIRWCKEALTRGQQGIEQRATILDAHAKALLRKHEASGDIAYVNEAIEKQQEALQLRPEEPRLLINLEHHLARKFHVTADLHLLDRRIELCRKGIKQSPPDDKVLRSYALHALGDALAIRYKHLGVRLDFDEAIAAHSQGLELRPPGNPNRWDSLLRLGLAYTEDPRAENKRLAVQSCRSALQCCPSDSPRTRAGILLHLSNCIVTQEGITIEEIDQSIELCKEANTLYPQGLSHLLILVRMYGLRYDLSQSSQDLAKAFHLLQDAHDTMPPDYSFRSVVLAMIALPYLIEPQSSLPPPPRDPFEMVEEVATSDNALLTELHLHVATLWVQAARKSRHKSLLKAYRFALNNLEQWLISYPTAEQQHSQVALRPHFASDACAAAIADNDIEQAIELLEQGRGLLWARLTRYRQPLDTLRVVNKELAEEFELVAKQLEQLSVETYGNLSDSEVSSMTGVLSKLGLLSLTPGSQHMDTTGSSFIPASGRQRELRLAEDLMGFDNRMRLLHDATSRWNDVVARIRQIEGWGNFLRPSDFHDLQKAAAGGPVIIVNVSEDRCDAIIMREDCSPTLVPLPDATPERFKELSLKLDHSLESLRSVDYDNERAVDLHRGQLKAVLRSLWALVVQPISSKLEEIGYQNGQRVWWYPTGALCRLPIHAAGPYKRGQKNFQDLYISSYVTTLSNALKASQNASSGTSESTAPRLLIIGVPGDDPTQTGFLPNVEEEVCTILDAVPAHLLPLQHALVGELATSAAVQSELPRYAWAHFTCHGYQNPEPLNSSFQLYSHEDVKLIELVRSRLPKAQLAFLSACNTATGDFEKTPDEVLHLAAVMQFCGFCSVIGTLWPMCDEDGPDVACDFYEFMFRDGGAAVDFRDSAEALHKAVQGLRRRKVPIERWINFVHFGL